MKRPSNLCVSLALLSILSLVACVDAPDDDEYDDVLYVDDADAPADGKDDSIRTSPVCTGDGRLSRSACALLATIAYAEGTGPHYDILFGYRRFTSFARHPRILVCAGSYCSTAAGRYQILSRTWATAGAGLPDFGPASQDAAALRLIRGRGVSNVDGIDTYDEFAAAMRKLNREWASLPGSPYGQPTYTTSRLWTEFKRLHGAL